MADRPILFQGEMVRATYAKLKSQTRRVIKPQPDFCRMSGSNEPEFVWWRKGPGTTATCPPIDKRAALEFCPYGVPGDTLWVRETWCKYKGNAYYKADGLHQKLGVVEFIDQVRTDYTDGSYASQEWVPYSRWKPSIHMPRSACRLELTVTKVRVERVQKISEEDAKAEGCERQFEVDLATFARDRKWDADTASTYRLGFKHLWDTINAKPKPVRKGGKIIHYVSYPWEDVQETREHRGLPWIVMGNPRVWPVDFEVKDA